MPALVIGYAEAAIPELTSYEGHNLAIPLRDVNWPEVSRRAVGILGKVIDQTERRVIQG